MSLSPATRIAPLPTATYATIPFAGAVKVIPIGPRFVVGFPAFVGEPLLYPSHYPADRRNKDGTPHPDAGKPHPEAGKPVLYKGAPYTNPDGTPALGVVVYNYEDDKWEALVSNGKTLLLFVGTTEEQEQQLQKWVMANGGCAGLNTPAKARAFFDFATRIGADDRFPSNQQTLKDSMFPTANAVGVDPKTADAPLPFGRYEKLPDEKEAVFVVGPAKIDELLIGPEGGVFVNLGAGKKARHVTPAQFPSVYALPDRSRIEAIDLPRVNLPLPPV